MNIDKIKKFLISCSRYIEIPFFLLRMGIIIFLAIKWAAFNDMFIIKNVEIDGINYFDETPLLSYKDKINNKGEIIKKSLSFLKNKAKTLDDIFNNAQYIIRDKIKIAPEDTKLLDNISKNVLSDFQSEFEKLSNINKENLEKILNVLISKHKTNFKGVGQPLRIALVGSKFGPGIYDIILSLDKNEVIKRLKAVT